MSYREDSHSPINQVVKDLEKRIASHKLESSDSSPSHSDPMEYIKMGLKGVEKTLGMVSDKLKDEAKKKPWSLIGKVAIGGFVAGFIIGHQALSRKKGSNE